MPRGLLRTLQRCLALLRASGAVGSLDVMELNPARDVRHQTAPARGAGRCKACGASRRGRSSGI